MDRFEGFFFSNNLKSNKNAIAYVPHNAYIISKVEIFSF